MLQRLSGIFPDVLLNLPVTTAVAVFLGGVVCWLVGGRFSRGILTLALVTLGASLGTRLPRWYGWGIDPMFLGMGCALALGVAGYLLHQTWVGIALGAVLAFSGLIGVRLMAPTTAWTFPPIGSAMPWPSAAVLLWESVPPTLGRTISIVGGGAMAAGILMSLLIPKIARAVLGSLVGLALLLAAGLPWIARTRPQWLARLPHDDARQASLLAGVVVLGVILQRIQMRDSADAAIEVKLPESARKPAVASPAPMSRGRKTAIVSDRMIHAALTGAAPRKRPAVV